MPPSFPKPRVLFFDVNETLLDMAPLKKRFNEVLGKDDAATLWFATMLQYALTMTVSNQYASLPDIGAAVLQMHGRNQGIEITDGDARQAIGIMRSLPAHPDVRPGLEQLQQSGFRLATLTNSSSNGVAAQMQSADLADCFERLLSVESVGKYKPHVDVYRWAAQQMQVAPQECMLVAAHGWDVAGASWAGLRSAFIERAGQQVFPLAGAPDVLAKDLQGLAASLA